MKNRSIPLLLLLIVSVAFSATAQQWEIDFGSTTDINQYSRIDAGIIDADGDAVLLGRFGCRHDWHTQLIKVHPDGSYERRVCEDLPKLLFAHDIVQLGNGNYFTVACRIVDTTEINYGGPELWTFVFDSNLETVNTHVYTQDTVHLIQAPMLLDEDDGTIVACGGWCQQLSRFYRSYPYMYRFSVEADTLACRYVMPQADDPDDPEYWLRNFTCHNILKNPSGNGYVFLCNGPGGGIGTALYDDNFQYVKAYRYILGSPGMADMDSYALGDRGYSDYFLSDDRLLFFGARLPWKQGIRNYLLTIGDLDLSWIVGPGQEGNNQYCGRVNHYELGFLHEEGRSEEPGGGKCMATVNDTTMYGCYYAMYYVGVDLQTGLCLFDRDMEILGGHFFDGDEYLRYWPQFVLPYSDGSCLLVIDGGAEFLSPYAASKVMKLTREEMNPIPTTVREIPEAAIQSKAYPNPAKDVLNIDISGMASLEGCRISITDALGRPYVDKFIHGTGNTLSVGISSLKQGVYAYRVYNTDNKLLEGKFVKE